MANLSTTDAVYGVELTASPSNYLTTHVSWPLISDNLNWLNLYLVRNTLGYPQSPDDGVTIYTATTDAVILRVNTLKASSGGAIATSATSLTTIFVGAASGIALTAVETVATNSSLGKKAKVSLNSSGVPLIPYSATVENGGAGYAVGDIIRIPGNTTGLAGKNINIQLGVSNGFHVYDTGATTAVAVNPGYGVTGTDLDVPKYYYSLFATYATSTSATPSTALGGTNVKWKKLGETSSFVVKSAQATNASGTITKKSTKDVLLDHLPAFYTKTPGGLVNKDLSDFLGLIAFHIDTYMAKSNAVFNMASPKTVDEVNLFNFLEQFGAVYNNTKNITQARFLLENLVHSYKYGGSIQGLQNYIEAYSGYVSSITAGSNLLPDYNTSSFVESIGNWYPDPNYGTYPGFSVDAPYFYTTGDGSSGYVELSDPTTASIDTYVNYLSPLVVANEGALFNLLLPGCSSATSAAVTTTVNGVDVTSTAVTVTTTGSTAKLTPGTRLLVTTTAGTGVLARGTVVTSILNDTQFTINTAPTTVLASADLAVSTSLASRALKVRAYSNGNPIKYYSGLRKGKTTTVSSSAFNSSISETVTGFSAVLTGKLVNVVPGAVITSYHATFTDSQVGLVVKDVTNDPDTSDFTVTFNKSAIFTDGYSIVFSKVGTSKLAAIEPFIAKVGDYVTGHKGLPDNIKVTAVAADGELTLSDVITANIPSGTTLYFSQNANNGNPGSADTIPIAPNTPYTYCMQFNANGSATKATTVNLDWYDASGIFISTSTGTSAAPISSAPVAQTAFATTWYPTYVTAVSPATAAYCQPSFQITNASSTNFYYVDAASLYKPISVGSASVTSSVATLVTNAPHNFKLDERVAVYLGSGSVYNTSSAAITAISQSSRSRYYSFSYDITSGGLATSYPTAGQASSVPMLDSVIGTNHTLLTGFEDARSTTLKLIANRVNLCPNPSFETNTTGWASSTNAAVLTQNNSYYKYTDNSANIVYSSSTLAGAAITYSSAVPTTPSIKVTGGKYYAFSGYLNVLTGQTGTYYISVTWYQNAGTSLGTITSPAVSLAAGSGWTRLTLSDVNPITNVVTGINCLAPGGAAYATISFIRTEAATAITTVCLDGVLVEASQTINPYFDGGFDGYSHETARDSTWEGKAYLSPSHLYLNRVVNQGNIDTRATDMIYYG